MSAVPLEAAHTIRLRRRLELAVEIAIAALDALDAPDEDLEDSHDREWVDEREREGYC
jgi:uncharacterized protein (DUF1778 family)